MRDEEIYESRIYWGENSRGYIIEGDMEIALPREKDLTNKIFMD